MGLSSCVSTGLIQLIRFEQLVVPGTVLGAAEIQIIDPSPRSLKTAKWVCNNSVVNSVIVM